MNGETIKVLISESDIQKKVAELAAQLSKDYAGKPLTLVCMLKGGVVFMADLARKLDFSVDFDFIEASSYGDATISGGSVKILKDLSKSATGKNILLVEDIIDTGISLSHIIKHLRAQNPESLRTCVFLDKPSRRVVGDLTPDYVGFTIPDEFAVGYGLDYAQRYRNLPYIAVLSPSVYSAKIDY